MAQTEHLGTERREAGRRREVAEISMVIAESQELTGKTVNLSAAGVLLHVEGSIKVFIDINGKRYRGHLVRGFPVETGATAWAVRLEGLAEGV